MKQEEKARASSSWSGASASVHSGTALVVAPFLTRFLCAAWDFLALSSAAFHLTYADEDGDQVELETESDLADALQQASARQPKILELFVRQVRADTSNSIIMRHSTLVSRCSPFVVVVVVFVWLWIVAGLRLAALRSSRGRLGERRIGLSGREIATR